MPLSLTVNGQNRIFEHLSSPAPLATVIDQMNLKADRVAVEHNGEIAPRVRWADVAVHAGDRLEVVHFVGGGLVIVVNSR
jgi:sulfur carrier protein